MTADLTDPNGRKVKAKEDTVGKHTPGPANETETCIYCDAEVPSRPVPDADNDTAWGIEALDHNPGCEWVVTRAHRIEEA